MYGRGEQVFECGHLSMNSDADHRVTVLLTNSRTSIPNLQVPKDKEADVIKQLRRALEPVRQQLRKSPFISGETPLRGLSRAGWILWTTANDIVSL
jgi:hypothetical protein